MYLALTIGGKQINLPPQLQGLDRASGDVGIGLVRVAIDLILLATVLLSLFFLVFGGLRWITSGGDSKQVEEARNTIIYSVVGMGIAFLSMLVINLISSFLNVPLF